MIAQHSGASAQQHTTIMLRKQQLQDITATVLGNQAKTVWQSSTAQHSSTEGSQPTTYTA
jgi:hypothetical protein